MTDRPTPPDSPGPPPEIAEYVESHAAELDPAEVARFLEQHAKPTDEPGTPLEWAVRVLRERGEGEYGEGLPVDRVVEQMREVRRRADA